MGALIQEVTRQINVSEVVSNIVASLILFAPRLVVSLILFGFFLAAWFVIRRVVRKMLAAHNVDPRLSRFILGVMRLAVLGLALVMAADQVGINVMSIVAGLGVAGLAISLAAQSTVANMIAGITLMWDRPFAVGDDIRVGDVEGDVIEMSFRSVRVLTDDHRVVTLPNTQLVDQNVVNNTRRGRIRLRVPFSIAYKEDVDAARRAILEHFEDDPHILKDPAPLVVVTALGDSGVEIEFRPWITDAQMERLWFHDYVESVKKALDAAGIEIPFPHLKVFYNPDKSAAEW